MSNVKSGWLKKFCMLSFLRYKSSTVAKKHVYGSGLVNTGSMFSNSKLRSVGGLFQFRKPTHIIYFMSKGIRRVAAGFGFSVFASSDRVYGGGVEIFSNDLHSAGYWRNGKRLVIPGFSGNIVDIAAGRRHFLVATEKKVYAFGDNAHGQCGKDPEKCPFIIPSDTSDSSVQIPSQASVKQVHCTLDTSFVLLESGELFSFGLGTDGQLGRNGGPRDWHCLPVEGDLKGVQVTSIKGSTDTLCAITTSGDLFMWGQNEYEQMSPFSNQIQVLHPVEIRLRLGKISAADTTATSSLILNSEGEVYVWGFGVVGQGPDISVLKRPVLIHPNVFSSGTDDSGKVKQIFAGNTSMFALSKHRNLYAWGINRFSHLGIGSEKDQYFPCQVVLPRPACDLSVAPDHTLFLV
ncbi:unnamed protein product [Enterobius vermicularis]|uniref:Williams-Beuren syndrome chromosomal region 16-like protein n=1 Tax=Enterobius vermicularis TaxID=51028 RepID=A0A0N4UVV3_ENTVE|nr:unnamed protein product [Enterobius vermicularis]